MAKKRCMMIGLDGADPFVIKKLIGEGRLPNIQKLLENGVATEGLDMIGAQPSVTPPNWCSLATGNWPRTHGVTCFFNHTLGQPLDLFSMNWDANTVESELIWETFSKNKKRSIMLNYCEAWPPRLENDEYGVFVDGTGVEPFLRNSIDFQKVITWEEGDFPMKEWAHAIDTSAGDCVVYGEAFEEMTQEAPVVEGYSGSMDDVAKRPSQYKTKVEYYEDRSPEALRKAYENIGYDPSQAYRILTPLKDPDGWTANLPEGAKVASFPVNQGLQRRFLVVSASDGVHYDTVSIYLNKKAEKPLGTATFAPTLKDRWSDFIEDSYHVNGKKVKASYKFRILELAEDGSKGEIYLSHVSNEDAFDYFYPQDMGRKLMEAVGPMLPMGKYACRQERDDEVTLESWAQVYDWHAKAADWLFEEYPDWEVFYNHMHGIDEYNHWYIHYTVEGAHPEHERLKELIYRMYEINDQYVGSLMKHMDENTAIFLCSDHAAVAHSLGDYNPGLGTLGSITANVMADLGFTVLQKDENGNVYRNKQGYAEVDWSKTRAIAQRSSHIYINLKGRDPEGIVEPEDYEDTVQEVISALYNYREPINNKRVVAFAMTRDEMEIVGMGGPHCGDIWFQVLPSFCDEHAFSPSTTNNEGWSLGNLLIMCGAGLKKGETINRKVRIVDVVPTICHLAECPMPSNVEGGVIWQALEGFEERKF